MGNKFKLTNPPGTVAGEAERMLLAHIWSHDHSHHGLGGYHLKREDIAQLRNILGDETETVLRGAGFEPHPRHRHQWWTGSRTPYGDEAQIRLRIKWDRLRAIVAMYGEREERKAA